MKSRLLVEKTKPICIGFVPQVDCAPIVVAHEKGIFARHGLNNIRLSRELGWGVVKEKISFGHLDASQATAGLALGLGLGFGMNRRSVAVPLILSLEGNAITLSRKIKRDKIGLGNGLQDYLSYEWKKERPMILAVPHHFSSHHSILSTWLERNGVSSPDNLELVSLPSFLMPRLLKAGHIDGFCAPEPWNSQAVADGTGWCPATSSDIASGHPESVFMVSGEYLDKNKATVVSVITALIESCRLCQETTFREELVSILARREYLNSSEALLWNSLGSNFNSGVERTPNMEFQRFSGGDTNRPGIEKASWALAGLRKKDTIQDLTCGALSTIYREDIYFSAERALDETTSPQPTPNIAPISAWAHKDRAKVESAFNKRGKLEEA